MNHAPTMIVAPGRLPARSVYKAAQGARANQNITPPNTACLSRIGMIFVRCQTSGHHQDDDHASPPTRMFATSGRCTAFSRRSPRQSGATTSALNSGSTMAASLWSRAFHASAKNRCCSSPINSRRNFSRKDGSSSRRERHMIVMRETITRRKFHKRFAMSSLVTMKHFA